MFYESLENDCNLPVWQSVCLSDYNEVNDELEAGLVQYRIGDFNGDHKFDIVKFYNHGTSLRVWLYRSNGNYAVANLFKHPDSSWYETTNEHIKTICQVGDFNGDGKSDLINIIHNRFNRVYLEVWFSGDDGTFSRDEKEIENELFIEKIIDFNNLAKDFYLEIGYPKYEIEDLLL